MAAKIRLARAGAKKRPFYRVVVADVRAPRDGDFIEKLGTFNPLLPRDNKERVVIDLERVKYWLGHGAKPTERLEKILFELGAIEKLSEDYSSKPKKAKKNPGKLRKDQPKEEPAAEESTAEESGENSEDEQPEAAKAEDDNAEKAAE